MTKVETIHEHIRNLEYEIMALNTVQDEDTKKDFDEMLYERITGLHDIVSDIEDAVSEQGEE